jgi:hypothetical protein
MSPVNQAFLLRFFLQLTTGLPTSCQTYSRPTNHKTYAMLMRRVSTTELYLMSHLHKRLNNSGGKKAKDRITFGLSFCCGKQLVNVSFK